MKLCCVLRVLLRFSLLAPSSRLRHPGKEGWVRQRADAGIGLSVACPHVPGDPGVGADTPEPADAVPFPAFSLARSGSPAPELLVSLDRLNTFGDDIFKDPKVLQSYYYAVSDFSVAAGAFIHAPRKQHLHKRVLMFCLPAAGTA
ncbi:Laminin subunit gamma-3 [Manis javanica]|nr:Laminin subunit gamma-3 [Manis javanica]